MRTEKEKVRIILNIVCSYFDISIKELNSKSRKREVVRPRQVFHYLARTHTKMSFNEIGRFSERYHVFNHATVLHSSNTVHNDMEMYADFNLMINTLSKEVMGQIAVKHPQSFLSRRMEFVRALRMAKTEDIMVAELINLL